VEALRGRVTEHHRFLLGQHLRTVEQLEATVREFDARIETVLEPFRPILQRLMTIPGIERTSAQIVMAEIGVDMGQFPTVGHLISWAGLCPRLDESAGKHRSTRVRKGALWLKPVLVQCAWTTARARGTYLQAQFQRLKARRGAKKAAIAVAASILTAAYSIIRDGVPYQDLGPDHFVQRDKARIVARLARRIRDLGYDVQVSSAA
jgi:transposase